MQTQAVSRRSQLEPPSAQLPSINGNGQAKEFTPLDKVTVSPAASHRPLIKEIAIAGFGIAAAAGVAGTVLGATAAALTAVGGLTLFVGRTLFNQYKKLQALSAENASLKAENTSLKNQNERIRSDNETLRDGWMAESARARDLGQQKSALLLQQDGNARMLENAVSRIQGLQQETQGQALRLERSDRDREVAEKLNELLKDRVADLERQREELIRQLQEAWENLRTAKKESADLRLQLAAKEAEFDRVNQALVTTRRQLAGLMPEPLNRERLQADFDRERELQETYRASKERVLKLKKEEDEIQQEPLTDRQLRDSERRSNRLEKLESRLTYANEASRLRMIELRGLTAEANARTEASQTAHRESRKANRRLVSIWKAQQQAITRQAEVSGQVRGVARTQEQALHAPAKAFKPIATPSKIPPASPTVAPSAAPEASPIPVTTLPVNRAYIQAVDQIFAEYGQQHGTDLFGFGSSPSQDVTKAWFTPQGSLNAELTGLHLDGRSNRYGVIEFDRK